MRRKSPPVPNVFTPVVDERELKVFLKNILSIRKSANIIISIIIKSKKNGDIISLIASVGLLRNSLTIENSKAGM